MQQSNDRKFVKDYLETTIRLLDIISSIFDNEFLRDKLVLKGGSAVECHLGTIKRLFSDVDLDYLVDNPALMRYERDYLKLVLFDLMRDLNYNDVSPKSRYSYSLDSLRFPYQKNSKNLDYMKLEINYTNSHLYPIERKKWADEDFSLDTDVLVINLEELLGMKIKALLDRGSVRDLYDIDQLIHAFPNCDTNLVRKAFVFYYGLAFSNGEIPNNQKITQIEKRDMIPKLYPYIPKESHIDFNQMKNNVSSFVHEVITLKPEDIEFIKSFSVGEYHPELLFSDEKTLERAKDNPIADYKVKLKRGNYR